MSHKPGPWEAVEHTANFPFPVGVCCRVVEKGGFTREHTICDITAQGDGKYEPAVTNANARLIAAAPELLAACKLALKAFEKNWAIDWNDLERAIAKAEEQQ